MGPALAERLEQLLLENDDLVRSMHEAVLKNRPRVFHPGGPSGFFLVRRDVDSS